jgi:hypothetical protein
MPLPTLPTQSPHNSKIAPATLKEREGGVRARGRSQE